jgi:UDP-N-acetylmuramyl pentapeptide phosphotransferase/UDP-N-acetylglucosamine-1-phosphate transferase
VTDPATLAIAAAATFVAAAVGSRLALAIVRRRLLDQPNARSSHRAPTPRGGGIGFVPVILAGIAIAALIEPVTGVVALLAGGMAVAAVSFADDIRSLPGLFRFAVQMAAVAAVLAVWPGGPILLWDGAPVLVDRFAVGFAWLWFINLFNFMDGIDGIAASEAGVVSVGVVAVAAAVPAAAALPALPAVIVGAAAIAFLTVNWPPARIFMGDVGSVGLGFLLGWLLVSLASAGYPAAAVILPLVFVLDATTTLARRAARGARLGSAHRDHAYQAAVDRGVPHAVVTSAVIVAGVGLIALAVWSVNAPVPALLAAGTLAGAFVLALRFGWPPFQRRAGAGETARRSR